jgi:hypothetical protein|tara:strand:+ start:925 stop:2634 length:1710 start_codon:yes stop_codon:yes gene_type:complete
MSIGKYVLDQVQTFQTRTVKVTSTPNGINDEGYFFSQYDTLQRIDHYINNKYVDRGQDEDTIFWNLANPRITHFAKNIDLDTKDLQPYGIGDTSFVQVFVLKQKFYRWLEDNKFAIGLNDMSEGIATYGSTVFKLYKGELKPVKLSNLYFDITAESVRDTPMVEMHYMSEYQLQQKKGAWDGVEKVLEKPPETDSENPNKTPYYEVWEYTGEYEIDGEMVYKHFIGTGSGDGEVIFLDENKKQEDSPYYDFHIGKYRGRWLRVGVVERLFDLQVRANELINQNRAASEIASLLLLRTQNGEQLGNVLHQVENGQIIQSDDLQQIGITNTGLNQFITELREIEAKADKLSLTPEIIQGDTAPSGTPFRSVAVVSNAAKSTFKYIKERIGETLGYILKEKIFPDLMKDWNVADTLELADNEQDVQFFDEEAKKAMKWNMFLDNVLNGRTITADDLEKVAEQFESGIVNKQRKLKYPKNYFNFEYGIRTNITGESVDKAQRNDAMFNALQMVQQNPAIVNTPLFRQYVEDNGINWWKLTTKQKEELQQGQAPPTTPIGGKEDKLLAQVDSTE